MKGVLQELFSRICFDARFADFPALAALVNFREHNFLVNVGCCCYHQTPERSYTQTESDRPPSSIRSHGRDQSTPHPAPGFSVAPRLPKTPRNSWQKTSRRTRARASARLLQKRWENRSGILAGSRLQEQGKASRRSSLQPPARGRCSCQGDIRTAGEGVTQDGRKKVGRREVRTRLGSAAAAKRPP